MLTMTAYLGAQLYLARLKGGLGAGYGARLTQGKRPGSLPEKLTAKAKRFKARQTVSSFNKIREGDQYFCDEFHLASLLSHPSYPCRRLFWRWTWSLRRIKGLILMRRKGQQGQGLMRMGRPSAEGGQTVSMLKLVLSPNGQSTYVKHDLHLPFQLLEPSWEVPMMLRRDEKTHIPCLMDGLAVPSSILEMLSIWDSGRDLGKVELAPLSVPKAFLPNARLAPLRLLEHPSLRPLSKRSTARKFDNWRQKAANVRVL